MKVSKEILEKILSDNSFQLELAKELNMQQQSIVGLARRNSEKLTLWKAVKFFMSKGYTEEEIFDNN